MLERGVARGRVVRLAQVAQVILTRYAYPTPVARLLGEALLVAGMLASNLRQEGILTLQMRGSGPVKLLVVDAVHGGQLRGYAQVIDAVADTATLQSLLGADAYLAVTLDPGEGRQRYQGVVALEGGSLAEALGHYFTHSQQLDVFFKLAVEPVTLPGTGAPIWMAGGFMLERMPQQNPLPRERVERSEG